MPFVQLSDKVGYLTHQVMVLQRVCVVAAGVRSVPVPVLLTVETHVFYLPAQPSFHSPVSSFRRAFSDTVRHAL